VIISEVLVADRKRVERTTSADDSIRRVAELKTSPIESAATPPSRLTVSTPPSSLSTRYPPSRRKNCYAERLALSLRNRGMTKYRNGFKFTFHEKDLELPLHWREPRRIFVDSMSDLFHEDMPDQYLRKCFAVMERAHWHTYQILTKRPDRMLDFSKSYGRVPDHIWMGTSVESWPFKPRIDILREVPARTRFVSFEPLIESTRPPLDLSGISWAIVGGESGPNYRPIKMEWIREIRDECLSQNVAFFFKQYGGFKPKSGGRSLDGRIWDEYPNNRGGLVIGTMRNNQAITGTSTLLGKRKKQERPTPQKVRRFGVRGCG